MDTKKQYKPPTIKVLGSLEELTQSGAEWLPGTGVPSLTTVSGGYTPRLTP